MTPQELAAVHRAAFTLQRPWSASEIRDLIEDRHVTLFDAPHGFALARTIAGESELLTLAVAPAHQGQGVGSALTRRWLEDATPSAEVAFLEVAADNHAALTLYQNLGFTESGLRKSYYARADGAKVDAILMQRRLTFGHSPESDGAKPESG